MANLDLWGQLESLKGYAIQLTGNTDRANDLLQETALKVLEKGLKYDLPLLAVVAKNIFINDYRRAQKIEYVPELFYLTEKCYQPDRLLMDDCKQALNRTGANGECLKLFYMGYSYQEIADKKRVPIGTIKSRIHIAKKQAQKYLKTLV
jgi:RNA polymerase sigma-70 factor (ECF subfamily)